MTRKNVVVQSINSTDGNFCVDVFEVREGGFGFEEYRRDIKVPSGWFPIGHIRTQRNSSAEEAFDAARSAVTWLGEHAPAGR